MVVMRCGISPLRVSGHSPLITSNRGWAGLDDDEEVEEEEEEEELDMALEGAFADGECRGAVGRCEEQQHGRDV